MAEKFGPYLLPAASALTMWALDKFGPEAQVWGPYVWAAIAAFWIVTVLTRPFVATRLTAWRRKAPVTSLLIVFIAGGIICALVFAATTESKQNEIKDTQAADPQETVAPATKADISWVFDTPANTPPFLGLSASHGEESYVFLFQAYGHNNSDERIVPERAFIRSNITDAEFPIGLNVSGQIVPFEKVEAIPSGADFAVMTWPLPTNMQARTHGITASRLLVDWASFTFVIEYNKGRQYRRVFSNNEIVSLIQKFDRERAEQAAKEPPKVRLKPEAQKELPTKPQPDEASNRTPTLFDLFKSDFAGEDRLCADLEPQIVDAVTGDKVEEKIQVWPRLCVDYAARSKFVGFYISNTRHTFDVCKLLIDRHREFCALDAVQIDLQLVGQQRMVGDFEFGGRIYIYHPTELSFAQLGALEQLFHEKGLTPTFRGVSYLQIQIATRSKHGKTI